MKKSLTIMFILIAYFAFTQEKQLNDGTYIAKNNNETIRLIIKDNKYDLAFTSGRIIQKNDSIILASSNINQPLFKVKYIYDKISENKKIEIFIETNSYDFYNLYFGNYNKNETPIYRKISDIQEKSITETGGGGSATNFFFENDRVEFIELIKENQTLTSEIFKFNVPNNVSQIFIECNVKEQEKFKLAGTFDKLKNELTISNDGRQPLTFVLEKQLIDKIDNSVLPIETKKVGNWSYPGKDFESLRGTELTNGNINEFVDKPKYQIQVKTSLQNALEANSKNPNKFLIIYHDPKNAKAKSDFDEFIKEQNKQLNYNLYDKYDQKFDLFEYYYASKVDEKWLKIKNIKIFPSVIAINSTGDLLSQSNKPIFDLQNQFYYYDDFGTNLIRTNALINFKKAISSKFSDIETIKAFSNLCALQVPYQEEATDAAAAMKVEDIKFVKPKIVKEIPSEEIIEEKEAIKESPELKEDVIETITTPIREDIKPDFNTYTKPTFDIKQVQLIWSYLIQTHKNDTKPNIDLAVVIIKELNNLGFTKQIFNKEKIIDQTNSLALDYLFKHFDAIEKARLDSVYNVDAIHDIDLLENAIQYIINGQIKLITPTTPIATQQKIIDYYKKLQAIKKSNNDLDVDYFDLLKKQAETSKDEKQYITEFDNFITRTFPSNDNLIEKLNDIFENKKESGFETWSEFKNKYANTFNNAAWFIVEKSKNTQNIKTAIKWSELSLKIEKNNHYYLDTLAQLYYKNGEKQKAIATEELAISFTTDDASEYTATLEKMKNGTY